MAGNDNRLGEVSMEEFPGLRAAGLEVKRLPNDLTWVIDALTDQHFPDPNDLDWTILVEHIDQELGRNSFQKHYSGFPLKTSRGQIEAFANVFGRNVRIYGKDEMWCILGWGTTRDTATLNIVNHGNNIFSSTQPLKVERPLRKNAVVKKGKRIYLPGTWNDTVDASKTAASSVKKNSVTDVGAGAEDTPNKELSPTNLHQQSKINSANSLPFVDDHQLSSRKGSIQIPVPSPIAKPETKTASKELLKKLADSLENNPQAMSTANNIISPDFGNGSQDSPIVHHQTQKAMKKSKASSASVEVQETYGVERQVKIPNNLSVETGPVTHLERRKMIQSKKRAWNSSNSVLSSFPASLSTLDHVVGQRKQSDTLVSDDHHHDDRLSGKQKKKLKEWKEVAEEGVESQNSGELDEVQGAKDDVSQNSDATLDYVEVLPFEGAVRSSPDSGQVKKSTTFKKTKQNSEQLNSVISARGTRSETRKSKEAQETEALSRKRVTRSMNRGSIDKLPKK